MKQLGLLPKEKSKYKQQFGGDLMTTRQGRSKPRSLSTRETMHLVLRSTSARGEWSFRRARNERRIAAIVRGFAAKNGIRIFSLANVGNHLHMQIKLGNRQTYRPFIRAVTGAIARHVMLVPRSNPDSRMAATKVNSGAGERRAATDLRAKPATATDTSTAKGTGSRGGKFHFWDRRPYTRIVVSLRAILNLRDYVAINRLEGEGYAREHARYLVKERVAAGGPSTST